MGASYTGVHCIGACYIISINFIWGYRFIEAHYTWISHTGACCTGIRYIGAGYIGARYIGFRYSTVNVTWGSKFYRISLTSLYWDQSHRESLYGAL